MLPTGQDNTEAPVPEDPKTRDFVGITYADREALEAYYDEWAATYDIDMPDMGYDAPGEVARLMAETGLALDAPILDAGCGTGLTGQALADGGFAAITGLDQSQAMLAQARAKQCYTSLVRHDLNQPLPFVDDSFAAAQIVATLTYIDNAAGLLGELCRVVRPDGPIVFTQRSDLYDGDFAALIERFEDDGRWLREVHSDAAAYIPDHPQFRDDTRIHYDVFRVR
ncbi:class I SAM-dependent methyltransferase [Salinisphaera sp. Q1T1-3]|uniref:class I SAM-dependent DNA methyltransferase n=1 Tax=Salinisphaera sp. Q1T1-3 TaxID=2321229 RepID=UPI000E75BA18|nr:class I SAM-dependent methyltransferase [Salinisphaera sp. Q1T1-3]RJS92839.1 class I SAM-dependent methyltransferase [Salinisphaera sp. Q1T1-3]